MLNFFSNIFQGTYAEGIVSQPQPSSRPLEPSAISAKVDQHCFSSFAALRTHQERRKKRKEIASESFKHIGAMGLPTDRRQFALMHDPRIIRETSLEGGSFRASINVAIGYFEALQKGAQNIFSLGLFAFKQANVLGEITTALTQMKKYLNLLPLPSQTPTSKAVLEAASKEIMGEIKSALKDLPSGNKVTYLPIFYLPSKNNSAHSLVCKLTETDGEIEMQLLNLGNGSDLHPKVNYTLEKEQPSFAFLPLKVSKEAFYGKLGQIAFCTLLRYQVDIPEGNATYDANNIYDVLLQLYKSSNPSKQVFEFAKLERYAADEQVSGNCPDVAVTNVINDILIRHGADQTDQAKLHLNRHFCSLVHHFLDYQKSGTVKDHTFRELLYEAIRELQCTALELRKRNQFTEQDLLICLSTLESILSNMKKIEPVSSKSTKPTRKEDDVKSEEETKASSNYSTSFRTSPLLEKLAEMPTSDVAEVLSSGVPLIAFEPPAFKGIDNLMNQLQTWIATAAILPTGKAFSYVSDCVRQLPIPFDDVTQKDVWDALPEAEIIKVIKSFKKLLSLGLKESVVAGSNKENLFLDQFMLIYALCVITDKLARRCKGSRLEGYAIPFLPYLIKFAPNGFSSLPMREDNERYTQMRKYCASLEKNKVIFPIAPELDVHQYVEDVFGGRYDLSRLQGRNHIEYLAQFLINFNRDSAAKQYCNAWIFGMPEQVHILYYFSFLSHCLFFRKGSFPSELKFSYFEQSGRPMLKMVVEGGEFHISHLKTEELVHPFAQVSFPNRKCYSQDGNDSRRFGMRTSYSSNTQRRLFNIFSSNIGKMTTNQAVCVQLTKSERTSWEITDKDAVILLLMKHPNLKFWQAVQEFSIGENQVLLTHEGVQEIIDHCLFQPSILLERLKEEPESTIGAVRTMVRMGLEHYRGNIFQLHVLWFLLRIGISFETYTPKNTSRQSTLSFYRDIINDLKTKVVAEADKRKCALCEVFVDSLCNGSLDLSEADLKEKHDQDWGTLFSNLFEAFVEREDGRMEEGDWFTANLSFLLRKNAKRCVGLLTEQSSRDAICNSIVKHLLKDSMGTISGPWKGNFPQFSCGDLVLDFFDGTLGHQKHMGVLKKPSKVVGSSERELLEEYIKKFGNLYWVSSAGKMLSLNGRLQYCPIRKQWTELLDSSMPRVLMLHFHDYKELNEIDREGHGFFNWDRRFRTYRKENGNFTVYDNKTDLPYLDVVKTQSGQLRFVRLDPTGQPFPYERVDIAKIAKSDPLYQYTKRFTGDDLLLCFIDQRQGSPKIAELHFYRQGLEFIGEKAPAGRQKLHCKQFPGMYLIANQSDLQAFDNPDKLREEWEQIVSEINHFDPAIILFDPQSRKWEVLLINCNLAHGSEDFSNEVIGIANGSVEQEGRYFSFEFDPIEGCLRNIDSDPKIAVKAQFYISLVFKMQRDYRKAEKYLYRLIPYEVFTHIDWSSGDLFQRVKDYSVASIVFNLRLLLFISRCNNLMTERQFAYNERSEFGMGWGMKLYVLYLKSQVPEGLRLSQQEQRKLLYAFRNEYRSRCATVDWAKKWQEGQPILNAQYNKFFNPNKTVTIDPKTQEISLSPPIFSLINFSDYSSYLGHNFCLREWTEQYFKGPSKQLDAYPIRIPSETAVANLPQLLERAKKGKSDLEFHWILHALLKTDYNSISQLGITLFIVHHFPGHFQGFSLENVTEEKKFNEILQSIVEKAIAIIISKIFKNFEENTVKNVQKYQLPARTFEVSQKRSQKESCPPRTAKPENPCQLSEEELKQRIKQTETHIYATFNDHYKKHDLTTPQEVEEEVLFLCQRISAKILPASKRSSIKQRKTDQRTLPETLRQNVIQRNNLEYIREQRPMLDQKDMLDLCYRVCEWVHLSAALKLKQEHRESLYVEHDYQAYPGISSYFLKTGKFPTRKQVDIYQKVAVAVKGKRACHFQLGAGQGKTDVITPLLHSLAQELHLMPISFVTSASYPRDKYNLTYNLKKIGIDLAYLELGMHMINKLTAVQLEEIYSDLKKCKAEGGGLVTFREAYYTIYLIRNLACQSALMDEESDADIKESAEKQTELALERGQKILWAQHIRNFFKRECLPIFDESDDNLDSLTSAFFGMDFRSLPADQRNHILEMMQIYLGVRKVPQSELIAAYKREFMVRRSKESKRNLRLVLAESFLTVCGIAPSERTAYLDWWTNKRAPKPASLTALNPLAGKIALTSRFLEILPSASTLQTDVDHARSPIPDRKHEVPAKDRKVSTKEYEDPHKAYQLTVKGDYARGLNEQDINDLIRKLIKLSTNEQRNGLSTIGSGTPTEALFKKWVKGTSLEGLNLNTVNLTDKKQLEQLAVVLGKQNEVIDFWLRGVQGVGTSRYQLQCSIVDLVSGFPTSVVGFSATPHSEEAYPISIRRGESGDYHKDKGFEEDVKAKLKEPQNSQKIVVPDGASFWETMQKEHCESLEEATVLIDPRDFFSTKDTKDLAKQWMRYNPTLEGVIFCPANQGIAIDSEERMVLLLRDGKTHSFCGNDIAALFKGVGLDWNKLKIGTIYNPENTRSLHVWQKEGALAFFFMGDRITTTQFIQATMRLRGFLDMFQRIIQIYRSSLATQIFKVEKPTTDLLLKMPEATDLPLNWTDANDKKQENKNIIMNAFSDIRYAVALQAEQEMEEAHATDISNGNMYMTTVIDTFREYRYGLVDETEIDPYVSFGDHEIMTNSRVVLENYAQMTYARFNYEVPYEKNETVKKQVNAVIAGIESRIKQMYSKQQQHVAKSVEQQVQIKVDVQKQVEKQSSRVLEPLALDGQYGLVKIYDPAYLRRKTRDAKEFSSFLTKGLYFDDNYLRTAKIQDTKDGDILKPIQFFIILITKENGQYKWQATANTNEIVTNDFRDMMECPERVEDLEHSALLFTADGRLMQRGKKALEPPKEVVETIMRSKWLYDLKLDADLLRGRILDPEALMERVKITGWDVFEELWNKVVNQLRKDQAYTPVFNKMKKAHLGLEDAEFSDV